MLDSIKVKVDPEQSRIIQELAFEQGYKWYDGTKVKKYIGRYLYLNSKGAIYHGSNKNLFVTNEKYVLYEAEYLIQNSNEDIYSIRKLNRTIS